MPKIKKEIKMFFKIKQTLIMSAALLMGAMTINPATSHAGEYGEAVFYVVSNKADGNSIIGYERFDSGQYRRIGEYFTDGQGTGDLEIPALKKDLTHPLANGDDPLISANALAATKNGKQIIVVNPGDATLSLLHKNEDNTLKFVGKVKASDLFPISVAVHGRYVVAASVGKTNDHGSIGAYKITKNGLIMIKGSRRDLGARPSTISFANKGRTVIVNELVTGKIKTYSMKNGRLSDEPVSVINSPREMKTRFHAIPVGFAIRKGADFDTVLMSEARFLTPDYKLRAGVKASMMTPMMKQGASMKMHDGTIQHVAQSPLYSWQTGSLSTYRLSKDGVLSLIAGDVMTGAHVEGGELANCWVALSKDGTRLWTVNALSSSISAFEISRDGQAMMVDQRAYQDETKTSFLSDIAVSEAGDELYQLIGNRGEVLVFDIAKDGALHLKQTIGGLPRLGSYGLLPL